MPNPRFIAVDWSGAAVGAQRKIWLAEARSGELLRVESGRDREQLGEHLVAEAVRDPALVVGLDFAFSLPAWFLRERGLRGAPALWTLAAHEGERWLAECAAPFWGRPGRRRGEAPEHFRTTEREVPIIGGIVPKSTFQIGGAGAVGTGSVRGMPLLRRLRAAGFSVWPFDAPALPLVVEIYPRLLTGAVNKSSFACRVNFLRERYPHVDARLGMQAVSSDDAFDAAVSALVMSAHPRGFGRLRQARDPVTVLEGAIWRPERHGPA